MESYGAVPLGTLYIFCSTAVFVFDIFKALHIAPFLPPQSLPPPPLRCDNDIA